MRGMVLSCMHMTGAMTCKIATRMIVTRMIVTCMVLTRMIVSMLGRSMATRLVATGGTSMGDGRPACVLFDHWLLLAFRLLAFRLHAFRLLVIAAALGAGIPQALAPGSTGTGV
jgi:hypothetical protein